jgi:hypothetical protein
MNTDDRAAFDSIIAEIFGALDKPLTEAKRDGFWKGLQAMSITDLARVRDLLLGELQHTETPRTFSVSDIWSAKRRLRAKAPTEPLQPISDGWQGDTWDTYANRLLLRHIQRQASHKVYYSDRDTQLGKRSATTPSELTRQMTAILVAYKAAWARDMREVADERNEVPVDVQKEAWKDCMKRAEDKIQSLREAK